MGMLILHLGYKSQPPPWLGLIQQGNSQVFAGRVSLFHSNWRVLTKDQWVLQTVGPSDSDTGLSHTPYLLSQNPFRRPCHTTLTSYQRIRPAAGGDSYLAGEAGVPAQTKGFLLQHIYSTKKRWWPGTSYQPKKAQLSREVRTLLDGDSPYSEIPSLKEDWMAKVDLKDAFFIYQ